MRTDMTTPEEFLNEGWAPKSVPLTLDGEIYYSEADMHDFARDYLHHTLAVRTAWKDSTGNV